ncbi:MAG: hypothetical protein IT249_19250 [Chitinophagaceae bacterium]|nr:hypothetical protein [Chitinophagaceae bacterium]
MRPIDRLYKYLDYSKLTPYAFEQTCGISNGYLKKQFLGKGSIGSDILEKIHKVYKDFSLKWVLTGQGEMILKTDVLMQENIQEEGTNYLSAREEVILLLRKQIEVLEASIADKDKIISLLENQLQPEKTSAKKDKKKEY